MLLSKSLDKVVDKGIDALGAPLALSGVLIAVVVFTPEGISALKAAYANQLQRTVNLCLGACLSTLGLTLPAVLIIGLVTGEKVILGLDPTGMVLVFAHPAAEHGDLLRAADHRARGRRPPARLLRLHRARLQPIAVAYSAGERPIAALKALMKCA